MCSRWRLRYSTRNIILTVLMVFTGTVCTLSAKWVDLNTAGGSNPVAEHYYDHPFIQVAGTYVAELFLFVVYKSLYSYRQCTNGDMTLFGDQSFNPLLWIIPSMLDMCSASLMYVGLTWTYAASYQIIRASGMIITAILSTAFFGTRLKIWHFIGMLLIGVGLIVVCIEGYVFFNGSSSGLDKNTVLDGDLLIIIAQFVSSLQMIVQEKIIKKYKILSIQALGWESIFGITAMIILLIPMYFIPWHLPQSSSSWQEHVRFEDTIDAFKQWAYTPYVLVPSLVLMFSSTLFNLLGLTATETWDSIARMALIIGSTIIVYVISLAVGWQKYEPLQAVRYTIVSIGVLIYYYGNNSIPKQFQWICMKIASTCFDSNEIERTPIMALQ